MKRMIIVLALLPALLMPASCSMTAARNIASESSVLETEQPASDTDAVPQISEPAQTEPAEEDTALPADPITLTVEALVADKDGTDGALPYITFESDGAAAINEDIDGRFGYLIGEDYCWPHYECFKGMDDRILSVLVVVRYDGDFISYTPYNLDLASGAWIDGRELLTLAGVSEEEMVEAELFALAGEFENEFLDAIEYIGQELYDEQYARTTSADNADLDRVWLGDGGQLMFAAKIYGFAGAEFYEYPIGAGYSYP